MSNIPEGGYFITGSNEYTQIWKLEDIRDDNIKVRDQGKNSDTLTLSLSSGNAELPLTDGSSATIHSDGNVINVTDVQNFVYTEKGALVNFTNGSAVQITEETQYNGGTFKDNGGNELGETININVNNPTSDLGLLLTGDYEYSYSNDDNTEIVTTYGTYINEYKDERIEVYYPESAMSINFDIGEVNYQITNVPTEGVVSKIILGGSCINQAAADLLGIGRLCGSDFTAATGIGAGQTLIKTFADANSPDKIVVLIAGYETQDTLDGANYVKNNPTEFSTVGVSKIV
jgi:hypothetical protein